MLSQEVFLLELYSRSQAAAMLGITVRKLDMLRGRYSFRRPILRSISSGLKSRPGQLQSPDRWSPYQKTAHAAEALPRVLFYYIQKYCILIQET